MKLPKTSGLDVLGAIRKDERTKHVSGGPPKTPLLDRTPAPTIPTGAAEGTEWA